MLEPELTDTVREFKSPPIRFIIIAAVMIIATLAGVIIFQNNTNDNVNREKYDAVVSENRELKRRIEIQANTIDSLRNVQYQYVLRELEHIRQEKEVNMLSDSIKTEIIKLKQALK